MVRSSLYVRCCPETAKDRRSPGWRAIEGLATMEAMPYVVKNKSTGQYLRGPGAWTRYLGQALQFPNGRSVPLHLDSTKEQNPGEELEILRLPGG